jgi:hypothetical protein
MSRMREPKGGCLSHVSALHSGYDQRGEGVKERFCLVRVAQMGPPAFRIPRRHNAGLLRAGEMPAEQKLQEPVRNDDRARRDRYVCHTMLLEIAGADDRSSRS